MFTDNAMLKRAPVIVEIVGPAGAGKTTVLSALNRRHAEIHPVYAFRRLRYVPVYAACAVSLLPFLLRQGLRGRWYGGREINRMIRLKAIYRILQRRTAETGSITILDQGPVYTLTVLAGFGSESTKDGGFTEWWEKTLQEWVGTLDLIIWLDAPDDVLLQRIHGRDKQHLVKDKPEQEAIDFLMRCRRVYRRIIDKMAASGGPKVLNYDTSQYAVAEIVENALAALNSAAANGR